MNMLKNRTYLIEALLCVFSGGVISISLFNEGIGSPFMLGYAKDQFSNCDKQNNDFI